MPEPGIEPPVIEISDLRFGWSAQRLVLDIPSLQIRRGERVFLRGPSGSGKSTLLSLVAGVAAADHGSVTVLGQDLSQLSAAARDHFRSDHIGFIFQMFNLIPYLSVVENVTLPCRFSSRRRKRALKKADRLEEEAVRLLSHLDMGHADLLSRPVTELSVGQQQRVAAARALIGGPELVIADEPTSALDADLRNAFVDLLFRECADVQATLLFVSHDSSLAAPFDSTLEFDDLNQAGTGTTPSLRAVS